ncbi:hypothetical protein ACLOJK_014053 [Asimina triloba]
MACRALANDRINRTKLSQTKLESVDLSARAHARTKDAIALLKTAAASNYLSKLRIDEDEVRSIFTEKRDGVAGSGGDEQHARRRPGTTIALFPFRHFLRILRIGEWRERWEEERRRAGEEKR